MGNGKTPRTPRLRVRKPTPQPTTNYQSKGEKEMKKLIIAIGIAALVSGCNIGKAAFEGEDMKI